MEPSREIDRLIEIMAALRHPETGCPWDIEQTFGSIAPYTIEEAYEVADAIERNDLDDLKSELGDLLLQVAYHARLAEEAGAFEFGDVVAAITEKMIRRHPYVFAEVKGAGGDELSKAWERIKAKEKRERQSKRGADDSSTLDDVPIALPGLSRAAKLQRRAAAVGFDWPDAAPVFDKLREEMAELEAEMADDPPQTHRIAEELGDVLFSVANLARHLEIDPEHAMQQSNAKFLRRFKKMEKTLRVGGLDPGRATLEQMDDAWQAAKAEENAAISS